MLSHLQIRAGQGSFQDLRQHCCWLMSAVALLDDVNAVDIGVGEIRRLVREGVRALDPDALEAIIRAKGLSGAAARATFLVQQLDHDPWPEMATVAVDWVDLFQGDEPSTRRQLKDPEGWNSVLRPQLRQAVATIKATQAGNVLIAGTFRLSTGITLGTDLPDVAGFSLAVRQRDEEWTTAGPRTAVELARSETAVGDRQGLAIGIGVSVDLGEDVRHYIEQEHLPVGRLVTFAPVGGVGRDAIADVAEARGFAQALIDAIRAEFGGGHPPLHLFYAGPLGLAVLLGHIWNRMPETQLYDDLGPGRGYAPTYRLAG